MIYHLFTINCLIITCLKGCQVQADPFIISFCLEANTSKPLANPCRRTTIGIICIYKPLKLQFSFHNHKLIDHHANYTNQKNRTLPQTGRTDKILATYMKAFQQHNNQPLIFTSSSEFPFQMRYIVGKPTQNLFIYPKFWVRMTVQISKIIVIL